MFNYIYKMIYFYQYFFDNNAYIGSILFKFLDYKLFVNIGNDKIFEPKIFVNLV